MHDTIIIGGGFAGLSAAIVLGRCRRRILIIDDLSPRNWASRGVHNFLSRDGIKPADLRAAGLAEARSYGATVVNACATRIQHHPDGSFQVLYDPVRKSPAPRSAHTRTILFATGVRDKLPDFPGFSRFYGKSIHHCPYCDAYEHRDDAVVAYGKGDAAVGLALTLRTWTARLTACTDGVEPGSRMRLRARRQQIAIRTEPVARLEGRGHDLQRVRFTAGPPVDCTALFFNTGQVVRSHLLTELGCEIREDGGIRCDSRQRTCIPGVYLAGDAAKEIQFAIVAAGQGATAAVAINVELQRRDQAARPRPPKRTSANA